jgi:pimeloyl-ACP methyl ester carboxylesterase
MKAVDTFWTCFDRKPLWTGLGGLPVHHLCHGAGDNVLFLHGLGRSLEDWLLVPIWTVGRTFVLSTAW